MLQNKEIFKKKLTIFGLVLITLSFVNEMLFNIASMKTDILRQNISVKVQEALKEQGRQKKWLYKQLGMSAPTLDSRLDNNDWTVAELVKLQDLLGIK